ncbi:Protein cobE [Actinoplanes sp. SE50]|uniref:cobalamin biosynthesis protein n=1 Tax=unclassified Actinoplanes TaxID=2626549 RepID=UPI00023ED64E|nr:MULTISPECIES: cobalamin biosynthesis protein [unclassified Actinoplanes]AEV86188.1 Protein cobE [Actinoplanes sp. SE50/110]ATO84586.1 Protein cobE [Actinoplanes sp. SE50]SLM01996.1 cobalamin biosynthesis protein CbiG [Actinoplanes sp. SE50/110]
MIVGVGARPGTAPEAVTAAITAALAAAGADPGAVTAVATLDRRAGLVRGWPVRAFTAADLAGQDVPSPSGRVAELAGTPSVAEAAALRAAGPGAVLILPKRIFGGVTVAIAGPV